MRTTVTTDRFNAFFRRRSWILAVCLSALAGCQSTGASRGGFGLSSLAFWKRAEPATLASDSRSLPKPSESVEPVITESVAAGTGGGDPYTPANQGQFAQSDGAPQGLYSQNAYNPAAGGQTPGGQTPTAPGGQYAQAAPFAGSPGGGYANTGVGADYIADNRSSNSPSAQPAPYGSYGGAVGQSPSPPPYQEQYPYQNPPANSYAPPAQPYSGPAAYNAGATAPPQAYPTAPYTPASSLSANAYGTPPAYGGATAPPAATPPAYGQPGGVAQAGHDHDHDHGHSHGAAQASYPPTDFGQPYRPGTTARMQ